MRALPPKSVIACVHLLPTPGSPRFDGNVERIYATALAETDVFLRHGVDALIVENFRDQPFLPNSVGPETTATIAGVAREVVRASSVPVGVAVLRNDAAAAMSIAVATGAQFIRVNVHTGAVLTEQGILTGQGHDTLRRREQLKGTVDIWADARVKHSVPFTHHDLAAEIRDLNKSADGIIVSGELTGVEALPQDLKVAQENSSAPVYVGSGVTAVNLAQQFDSADGFIVGSDFKEDGVAARPVEEGRVKTFMNEVRRLREASTPA
ncbi:BtpA/SgcQ family protein [Natronoglycomyces albus]|uniref:BtpA/SgcQ family protein n=1 Tax=Natronoglycomyces albus TaxID=2811108 RepID=A0A895XIN0_9ACTN|nr:BtpA/SgcQ family protein [Natronoglycomyces albus]QSB05194.1 BtpA/SgcQ family protein [Natronoglycomyces albus]